MSFKTFTWIAIALVIVGILFISWDKVKAAVPGLSNVLPGTSGTDGANGTKTPTTGTTVDNAPLNLNKQLSKGSTGREVQELQRLLNRAQPTNPLKDDGIFGAKTEAKLLEMTGQISLSLAQGKLKWPFL